MPSGAEEKAERGTPEFDFSAIVPGLLHWYDRNARILPWREDFSPYRVWISEIMLQQTRVEAAKPYFERFLAALPDLASLASAPEELLLKLWEGLGYYSRVRNLARCARIIQAEYGGHFPGSAEELRRLPGIGEYTAGAIASISFGLPEPAVDGNVLRVAARLTGYLGEVTQPRFRKEITGKLRAVYPAGRCGDFTQSLMELGAVVCLPNGAPKCSCCPLEELCEGRRAGTAAEIPVRAPKKPRRVERRCVFLLCYGERVALRKRPPEGLLAGLWEFPALEGAFEVSRLAELGIPPETPVERVVAARHVFSHLEWEMQGYLAELSQPVEGYEWVTRQELETRISLPSAFRVFRRFLLTGK